MAESLSHCNRNGEEMQQVSAISPLRHQPSTPLTTMHSSFPFAKWGMNILAPFPKATGQRKFLFVLVDYFTKWVEAEAFASITGEKVQKFI